MNSLFLDIGLSFFFSAYCHYFCLCLIVAHYSIVVVIIIVDVWMCYVLFGDFSENWIRLSMVLVWCAYVVLVILVVIVVAAVVVNGVPTLLTNAFSLSLPLSSFMITLRGTINLLSPWPSPKKFTQNKEYIHT